jgi:superfamily II DNA/RNA helicase
MALRNGQVQILVATDVAARGIDVPTITHVFNFGLPMKAEDYTHRIGRTGRAGRDGLAVTFAEIRDRRKISDIESYTRQPFKAEVIPGLEPKVRMPEARKPMGRGGDRFGGDRNYANAGGGFRGGRPAPGGRDFGGNRDRDNAGGGFDNRAPRGNFRDEQPRFEQRAEPRFDQRKEAGRFDAPRGDNRGGDRFEQRAAPAHPWDKGDSRPAPRQAVWCRQLQTTRRRRRPCRQAWRHSRAENHARLIVFLGSTQDFKIPTKVLPSPARPFFMDGMDACFKAPIKKPPWAQTRAVFS